MRGSNTPENYTFVLIAFFVLPICILLLSPHEVQAARLWSSGCELEASAPGNMTDNMEWSVLAGAQSTAPQISTSVLKSGDSSCGAINSSQGWTGLLHQFQASDSTEPFYIRFYIYVEQSFSEDVPIAVLVPASSLTSPVQLLGLGQDMKLRLYDDDPSVIATAAAALDFETWYRIEWYFNAGTDVSTVRVNGSQVLNNSSFNASGIGAVLLGMCPTGDVCTNGIASGAIYFDDVAINDTIGSFQNSWPGDGSIVHMQPNGSLTNGCLTGSPFSWTDVTPDDDSSFCEITNVSSDVYSEANVESPSSAGIPSGKTISLVQVGIRERQVSNLPATIYVGIASAVGGTMQRTPSPYMIHDDTTYRTNGDSLPRNYSVTAYVDPTTLVPWTLTGTNSLDNMILRAGCISDCSPNTRITAVWALVEYVPPPPPPPGPQFDLAGYAWSPNIGWISFNCVNNASCGVSDYKVTVQAGAPYQTMTGYAWSSTIGWISFTSSDLSGCPSGTCIARMDTVTGEVIGWARALSGEDDEAGGWEGWIHLSDANYGVLGNGPNWTGYAWGGGPTTGTGVFSPERGGNAVVGWISFRGFTSGLVPTIYGVTALGPSVGPYSIACGVEKDFASKNETVAWSVVVNPSIITGTPLFDWNTTGGILQQRENHEDKNRPIQYDLTGVKRGSVKVTAGTKQYMVTCDAGDVPGQAEPSPWYPEVYVGDINLQFQSVPSIAPGTLKAGADTASFTANANCVDGGGAGLGCDYSVSDPLTIPFDNVIQIVPGIQSSPLQTVNFPGQFVVTAPAVTSIYAGQDVSVSAEWIIPEEACPWGTGPCTISARACADVTAGPGPAFVSWDGVVREVDEANSNDGSYNSNNCSPWMQFSIEQSDAPPPSGGTCRPVPSVTQVGKTVVWTIDPASISGGEPPLEYKWETLPANTGADALSGVYSSSNTENKVYDNASPPTKQAQVTVRDSKGREATPVVCSAVVRIQKLIEF